MIVTQDERTASRYEASYPVFIEVEGQPIAARSLNLGTGGLCVEPGLELPERTAVLCRLDADGRPLEARGEVAWQYTEDGIYRMGIRFSALSPSMAGWLSSVATTHTKVLQAHAPLSDTQPMKVPPVDATEPEVEAPVPKAEPVTPDRAGQLEMWSKSGAPATPRPSVEPTVAVETDVLYDDMPTPEDRLMQARGEIEAMSAKHRLARRVRETRDRATAMMTRALTAVRTRRTTAASVETVAPTPRLAAMSAIVPRLRAVPARLVALLPLLRQRRVQLVLASVAALLLVGSGLAVLFSGGGDEAVAEGTAPTEVPATETGSYWDPPAMPAAAAEPGEPVAAEAVAERHAAAPLPDTPLPEPPVVGGTVPSEEQAAAAADVPPELPAAGSADEPSVEPPRRARAAERARPRARTRTAERRAADAEPSRPRTTREREERAATPRSTERTSERARARSPERADRTARAEPTERTTPAAPAAPAASPGQTTFRLNLSGAPGPVQSYPLANPNGIVIDVPNLQHPGSATKLTSDDPRIRFVKIMNREQGVRFIVYLHGALPRYRIEPSGRGIRVALD